MTEQLREDQEEESQLRDTLYAQALEELRYKADVIKTLCHKVAFLEGSMKLKDVKIATLTSQLELGPSDSCTSARLSGNTSSQLMKLRRRPRTQI